MFKKLVTVILTCSMLLGFVSQAAEIQQPVLKTSSEGLLVETISEEDHDNILSELSGTNLADKTEKKEAKIAYIEKARKAAESVKVDYYKESITKYAGKTLIVHSKPKDDQNAIGQIKQGDEVQINGKVHGSDYVVITYNGEIAYIEAKEGSLNDDKWYHTYNHDWDGAKLNVSAGVVLGPNGYESYYNLPMNGIVSIMRSMGFSEEEYPYWVREDGAKMLGEYIMVAADLSKYPRGTTSMCSLGQCIVCDTGGFIHSTNRTFDVATAW